MVAGALLVVNSAVSISEEFGVPSYLISFFAVAIGTSLPELFVCVSALRKGQGELAIGNILGSNITDTTLALAAGPLLVPGAIPYAEIAIGTGQYMVIASILAVALFVWRAKLDRKAAIVLIAMYFASYLFLLGL